MIQSHLIICVGVGRWYIKQMHKMIKINILMMIFFRFRVHNIKSYFYHEKKGVHRSANEGQRTMWHSE